jgi:hypothetical protein
VRVYKFSPDGMSLQLLHTTPLGSTAPSALAEFEGRLLVGCGRSLRLMECGKKKMLRKCEFSGLPNIIASIHTMGSRIYVGDAHESFHFMRYKRQENSFYVFADDSTPRYASHCAVTALPTDGATSEFLGEWPLSPRVLESANPQQIGYCLAIGQGILLAVLITSLPVLTCCPGQSHNSMRPHYPCQATYHKSVTNIYRPE